MRNQSVHSLQLLRRGLSRLPAEVRAEAEQIAAREPEILQCLRAVHERKISARRIRCHGDLHLGEALYTGKDFIFCDFSGQPTKALGERRIKRPALRDVASMIRSFDYAASAALFKQLEAGTLEERRLPENEAWAVFWHRWASAAFLRAYLVALDQSTLNPRNEEELKILLSAHLLEKTMFEISYELQHRPKWLHIPLRAVAKLLETWKA